MSDMLREAGRNLADILARHRFRPTIVIAVPRRGILVGHEIARRLRLPLDLVLAVKVFGPGHHPAALGAVALGGVVLTDPALLTAPIPEADRDRRFHEAAATLDQRLAALRGDRPLPDLRGHRVLLVDDAVVTGLTATAAVETIAAHGPGQITVATALCGTEGEIRLRERGIDLLAHVLATTPAAARRHAHAAAEISITDDDIRDLVADAQRSAGADLYQGLEIDGLA